MEWSCSYYYCCLPFKRKNGRKITTAFLLNEKINMPQMLCQGVMTFAGDGWLWSRTNEKQAWNHVLRGPPKLSLFSPLCSLPSVFTVIPPETKQGWDEIFWQFCLPKVLGSDPFFDFAAFVSFLCEREVPVQSGFKFHGALFGASSSKLALSIHPGSWGEYYTYIN